MKPLIIANWKMNPTTTKEAKKFFGDFKKELKNIKNAEVVICPPFVYLATSDKRQATRIKLGGQDCFWEAKGAYTGEISPQILKDLGCQYVILGHSERRKYLGETNEMINKKIKTALKNRLRPILCVGETLEERKKGKTNQVIQRQLTKSLQNIQYPVSSIQYLTIAYEPIWAIRTGNPCLPQDAKEVGLFIRKILSKILGKKISESCRIIYGGSVNSKNAADYIKKAEMNGLLVGGASLSAKEFGRIVRSIL